MKNLSKLIDKLRSYLKNRAIRQGQLEALENLNRIEKQINNNRVWKLDKKGNLTWKIT